MKHLSGTLWDCAIAIPATALSWPPVHRPICQVHVGFLSVVDVGRKTVKEIKAQPQQRHYEGLLL
jgi:hypothetical protein